MPGQRYSHVEVTLGLFVAFCLALFVSMVATYGHFSFLWQPHQELVVVFADAAGLRPEASVRFNGLEVGRVKRLRTLRLDKENLASLPALTKRDLDNLPLRAEVKRRLREKPDSEFETRCLAELEACTMIEITLDVVCAENLTTYRQDDQFRIVSTVFGDNAVEIISGNGAYATQKTRLHLGTAGDFFTNLAKSMGDVKGILESVSTVAGPQEQQSFQTAGNRFGAIVTHFQALSELAAQRTPRTRTAFERLSQAAGEAKTRMDQAGEALAPQLNSAQTDLKSGVKELQEHLRVDWETAARAGGELSGAVTALRADWRRIGDEASAQLDETRVHVRALYEYLAGLSGKAQQTRATVELAAGQSLSDWQRFRTAASHCLLGVKQVERIANENKDKMWFNKEPGVQEYNAFLSVCRHLERAALHYYLIDAELDQTVPWLAGLDLGGGRVQAVRAVQQQWAGPRADVEQVRDFAEGKLLPAFERKRSGQP